jgi:hypothetical protein
MTHHRPAPAARWCNVQTGHKIFAGLEVTIAVLVFEDRNFVCAGM